MNPDDLAANEPPAGPDAAPAMPPTILNVNDDDANRYALTRILRTRGFRVEEARDGAEALRRVADARPDLVLLDVDLPDLDGFEVCRRIKADPETAAIPVLHLSAHFVLEEDRTHGLVSGADGYLIQPVEPLELVVSIRGLIRMRDAEAAARRSALRVEQLESELKALERLVAATTPSAAPDPNFRPLREEQPEAFRELIARCEALLDLALDAAAVQGRARPRHGPPGHGPAARGAGAGPRDVIEIYGSALKSRSRGHPGRPGAGVSRRGPDARPRADGPPGHLLSQPMPRVRASPVIPGARNAWATYGHGSEVHRPGRRSDPVAAGRDRPDREQELPPTRRRMRAGPLWEPAPAGDRAGRRRTDRADRIGSRSSLLQGDPNGTVGDGGPVVGPWAKRPFGALIPCPSSLSGGRRHERAKDRSFRRGSSVYTWKSADAGTGWTGEAGPG